MTLTIRERRERRDAQFAQQKHEALSALRSKEMQPTVGMALGTERIPYMIEALAAQRGWVYFIQAQCGSIKIGRARNVRYRLDELQCANPHELNLLAVAVDGGREREYHRQFAEHRTRGEWFSPHPDILAEIDRLNARSPSLNGEV